MIAHRGAKKPKKAEVQRINRMMTLGCVCCGQFGGWLYPEVHHIVEGNRRLGHWYSLPICKGHHRGAWTGLEHGPKVALSDGSKRFEAVFGTERQLWKKVQDKL